MRLRSTIDDFDSDSEDEFHREAHEKLEAPPGWDGPVDYRRCTDIPCLLLIFLVWVMLSIIGVYAWERGDPRVIVYPMDYDGNICGIDFDEGKNMTDYPFLYYVNSYTGGVCVKNCPTLEGLVEDNLTDVRTLITYDGVWQTEDGLAQLQDAKRLIEVADYSTSEYVLSCTTDLCFPNNDIEASWKSPGIDRGLGYAYYVGDTYPLFNRCYLTTDAEVRIAELTNSFTDRPADFINPFETHAFWTNLYGDLWTARYFIFTFGFGASLLLSLIYVILLRIPFLLKTLVWTSVLCVISIFAVAGYYAQVVKREWEEEFPPTVRENQIRATEIGSYILFGLSGLFALLACCFRSSLDIAIECVRESGRAINQMVFLFGIPFLQGAAFLVFWIVWGFYAVHLASLGEISSRTFSVDLQGTEISIRVFEFSDFITYCGWFLLFSFFWTGAFVLAVGNMTVAMAVARWYFTENKRRVNSCFVFGALVTTLRFHLGTCAFGSLLISIVRLLRAIMIRAQKTVTSLTNKKIASMLLCCCQCCLCCIEKILQFINKNAYVQCAIFGTPFAESGRKAFFLMVRNAGRIGAISYVGGAVLFVGKLFISSLTTAVAYYVLLDYSDYLEVDLYSYGGPIFLVFCLSFFIASMFMGVFDIGILTVLHCFVADEEMFDGDARYADRKLLTWVDDKSEKS